MRILVLSSVLMFALGALIAERYGLPEPLTNITDKGFSQIARLVDKTPLAAPAGSGEDASVAADTASPAAPRRSAHAEAPAFRGDLDSNDGLTVNEDGLDIIKTSRGLHLSAVRTADGWTIGYGHRASATEDMTLTVPQAEKLLREDLAETEAALRDIVAVPMSSNEFSALASFTLSIGGIEALKETEVLDRLNRGERAEAAAAMLQHTMIRRDGELVQMPSLVERRERERALFMRDSPPAIEDADSQ